MPLALLFDVFALALIPSAEESTDLACMRVDWCIGASCAVE